VDEVCMSGDYSFSGASDWKPLKTEKKLMYPLLVVDGSDVLYSSKSCMFFFVIRKTCLNK